MTAAVDLTREMDPRFLAPDVERAGALRAVVLVAGERKQIDAHRVDVDRHLASRLRGVGVEERPGGADDGADLGERLQDADLVVGGHHRHEHGLVGDRCAQLVELDEPVRVDTKARDPPAFALERLERIEHRLVLGHHRHDVVAAFAAGVRRALDRQVVRLGRAAREYNLARRRADERGDFPAGTNDSLVGLPAVGVLAAGRIAEALGEVRQHRLEHTRIDRCRGVVVEIDRLRHCGTR